MPLFSQADMNWLSGPHVARVWFLELDLPSGVARYHNGVGEIEVDGKTWLGVSDPVGGQLVAVSEVEYPRFGTAPTVVVTIAAPSVEFFRSVKQQAREIEGRRADVYWAAFDPETEEVALALRRRFPGRASSPKLARSSGVRAIRLTIESIWQAQNYPFGGMWSPAGQRKRFAGDKGMDFVGVKVSENWK